MQRQLIRYGLSAVAGGFSVLAYAPFELWWLMPLCLACLYFILEGAEPKKVAKHGFLFGLFQFGFGVSWVYVSLNTFGNMPPIMAAIAVAIFVAILALYFALASYCFAKFKNQSSNNYITALQNAVLFAAIWVLFEWLRGYLFTGFPWLDIGYTQTTRWLSGYAPLGGVYLVGFMTVLLGVLIAVVIKNLLLKRYPGSLIGLAYMLGIAFTGKFLLAEDWSQAMGREYKIGVIQANIPIEKKWRPDFRAELIKRYQQLSPDQELDLLIFPETAMPVYRHNVSQDFWSSFGGRHKAVLSGIIELEPDTRNLYNSAVLNCGADEQVFRKTHLVPFGEYLPLRSLFSWVLDYLQLPMSDFSSWDKSQTLSCNGLDIALSICYEDAFAQEMASNLRNSGVLINISEDAWFGDSLAPHQRQQMAQMRALEVARPMVRSSNSGPSTFIDHKGNIKHVSEMFSAKNVVANVQPMQGLTPFAQSSSLFLYLLFGVCLLQIIVIRMNAFAGKHQR